MFTITGPHLIYLAIGLLIGLIISRVISKNERTNNTFWSQVFASNRELDSTLGIFAFVWIVTIMVFHFQDSLKDATEVGYIILAATNGLSGITGVKMGANMERTRNGDKN